MLVCWIVFGIAVLLLSGIAVMLWKTVPIAKKVYFSQLVRETPEKWGRVCSAPDNPEQLAMWNAGCAWAEENRTHMRPVHIQNGQLRLAGEYYDFGAERCVIILPGRCESLCYSYYFAPPYVKAGCNVLVIDTRAHGQSDGMYNTLGRLESEDLLLWMDFAQQTLGNRQICLHAVCVGSNTALLAAISSRHPEALFAIICEGCYVSFRETFRRHMLYIHKPTFPVLDLCMWMIRHYAGTNVRRIAPIRLVRRLQLPILYLFGKQDAFSVPSMSRRLFQATKTPHKQIVWFAKGTHSYLRLANTAQYDQSVLAFLQAQTRSKEVS